MASTGICRASRWADTISGPNSISASAAAHCQLRSNQPLAVHITAPVRPKPSMARLTTSDPTCAQLPIANTRMTAICRATTAPATSPTER